MSRTVRTDCPALSLPSVSNPGHTLDSTTREALENQLLRVVGVRIPRKKMGIHSLIVGVPGSGKTIAQKLFMASFLSDGGTGITYRSAMFDPKNELYPFLRNLGIGKEHLIVTHPFAERCVAWNVAEDFTEIAHAETFAQSFFPVVDSPNANDTRHADFWQNASNDVLTQVICGLMKVLPGKWELRDVTEICSDIDTMKQVLDKTLEGRRASSNYFNPKTLGDDKLPAHVRATIRSRMYKFHVIATLLHKRKECFSIRKWREGSGILLLGHDTERPSMMTTFNNLLVSRLSQIAVHGRYPANAPDLTWLFFDELIEAGELTGFARLLNFGRERGVRVMLGFCDKAGLEKAFASHKEILGLCSCKIFFRAGSHESAKWAADECGSFLQSDRTDSQNHLAQHSMSRRFTIRHRVLPDEFSHLPESAEGEITCFATIPGIGVVRTELPASEVDAYLPERVGEHHPDRFRERPPSDQDADGLVWDYESLGIDKPRNHKNDNDDGPPLRIFRP